MSQFDKNSKEPYFEVPFVSLFGPLHFTSGLSKITWSCNCISHVNNRICQILLVDSKSYFWRENSNTVCPNKFWMERFY